MNRTSERTIVTLSGVIEKVFPYSARKFTISNLMYGARERLAESWVSHEPTLGFRVWKTSDVPAMPTPHTHSDVEVNYLVQGSLSYLHGGARVQLEAQRFAVLWGGIPHRTLPPGLTGWGIWMSIPLTWVLQWQVRPELVERLLTGDVLIAPSEDSDLSLLQRWYEDYVSEEPRRQRVLALEVEARFIRVSLALEPAADQPPLPRLTASGPHSKVNLITDFLARNYQEQLTIKTVAAAADLHPNYLMRLFKQHTLVSVWEYVTRLRLAHAQRLLLTTDGNIAAIAFQSGFGSLGGLYRAFARYAPGFRPLEYRRLLAAGLDQAETRGINRQDFL